MLPKMWFRASKKAWYLQVGRNEQIRLGKTKDEAERRYRQWLLEEGGQMPADARGKLTIAEIAQEFLDHSKRHNGPKTYRFYCYFVVPFAEKFGAASAAEFIPRTFNKWLDDHEGWKGSRRCAIVSVKRMFNWAVDEKLLRENPLKLRLVDRIKVNDRYGPGDLVPAGDEMKVAVRVLGPSWVDADRVELFANGIKIRESAIRGEMKPGVKWEGVWKLPKFRRDAHLVAVATGPGVRALYWPISKPYQPTSPVVERRVIGITGAVWIDGDGDGKKSCAYDDARRLFDASWPRQSDLIGKLADCDEAISRQVASLLQSKGVSPIDPNVMDMARKAGPHVERGFQAVALAWRENRAGK